MTSKPNLVNTPFIKLLFVFSFIGFIHMLPGQQTTFANIYSGEADDDFGWVLQHAPDGGYYLIGHSESYSSGAGDPGEMILFKTDTIGLIEWGRMLGGSNNETPHCLINTSDGGYALTGVSTSFGPGPYAVMLVKFDANMNIQWAKTYGSDDPSYGAEYGYKIIQTSDDGYSIVGTTYWLGSAGSYDWLHMKTDSLGNLQWCYTYGDGDAPDEVYSIYQTPDDGYVLAGRLSSGLILQGDLMIAKTNASGQTQWARAYGGGTVSWLEQANVVLPAPSGHYFLAGLTRTYGQTNGIDDILLMEVDANGDFVKARAYGDIANNGISTGLQTPDGGYLLLGSTFHAYTEDTTQDRLLIKIDANWDIEWIRRFYGTNLIIAPYSTNILETNDGGYALFGYTTFYSGGYDDWMFIKTNNVGQADTCSENHTLMQTNIDTMPESAPYFGEIASPLEYDVTSSFHELPIISMPTTYIYCSPVIGITDFPDCVPKGEPKIRFASSIFSDRIMLEFTKPSVNPLEIKIYNALGSIVFEKFYPHTPWYVILENNKIKALPAGAYFLHVSSGENQLQSTKLIKL